MSRLAEFGVGSVNWLTRERSEVAAGISELLGTLQELSHVGRRRAISRIGKNMASSGILGGLRRDGAAAKNGRGPRQGHLDLDLHDFTNMQTQSNKYLENKLKFLILSVIIESQSEHIYGVRGSKAQQPSLHQSSKE